MELTQTVVGYGLLIGLLGSVIAILSGYLIGSILESFIKITK